MASTRARAVKAGAELTLRDRLSRLTFDQASQLLGTNGRKLLSRASRHEIDFDQSVILDDDLLRVTFPGYADIPTTNVTLALSAEGRHRLKPHCDACDGPCEHVAAMLSLVLERKTLLGLAVAPPEREPVVEMTDAALTARAIADRVERAKTERMKIESTDAATPWADYVVTSLLSGKSYRVSLRGFEAGTSYCSCPDFRTNTLGTCKHVMKVAASVRRRFGAEGLQRPFRRTQVEVFLNYAGEVTLRVGLPVRLSAEVKDRLQPWTDGPVTDVPGLLKTLAKLETAGTPFVIFPDAEEHIQQHLHALRLKHTVAEIRRDPARHPLRKSLLKVELLPYQMDGIAFIAGSGRAVLADDMGLGKTIQAVGVAESLAQQCDIRRVLVICPASLKSQWVNEVRRFCDRDAGIIAGRINERAAQYQRGPFFTMCNYEQVLKDILAIEQTPWDLIILDEGQRIKNWESKTSRVIKGLRSRFALVLSGTPLENRLDELFSVVQFIDDRRLGPGFRFFNTHRIVDEKGKVLGYRKLDELRQRLAPVLLRRTRDSVKLELPEKTTEIVRIAPSQEQLDLHNAHLQTVASIVRKKFITEMDLMRLRMSLLMCRMSADGTFLVDKKKPNHSTKLDRLAELFDQLAEETGRKVVLFSEWTTMLDLIEPLLNERKIDFVRLDGSVPQKDRQTLINRFQTQPDCQFFLSTNAGSTGLNLQAANTVINVDLPWNPATLEQRIGRAYRMGQKQPVQVYLLITEQTLEENLLVTLGAKKDLAMAALDPDTDVDEVSMESGTEELKSRLEILLGARAAASVDQTQQAEVAAIAPFRVPHEHRQRVAEAGGQLLGAVFQFLGELVADEPARTAPPEAMVQNLRSRLHDCVEADDQGRPRFTVTLPNAAALDGLAQTLARLLVSNANP